MKKHILNPLSMAVCGLISGALIKLFDIYTQNLGNIFSQLSIWILLGVLISVFSETKKKAMLNIFPFCVGMLITYYFTAEILGSYYGKSFVIGWACFTLLCPVFAYFTWMTKERGAFPKIISAGIIALTLLASVVMFSGPRIYDYVITAVLIYVLFFMRVRRKSE